MSGVLHKVFSPRRTEYLLGVLTGMFLMLTLILTLLGGPK